MISIIGHDQAMIHKKWTVKLPCGLISQKMDHDYDVLMDTAQKQSLAMINDFSQEAAAIRARAARTFAGLNQGQLAEIIGTRNTTISNIEKGLQFPSRALLQYFFHEHRLDFNFMMAGLYATLPGDVQDRIFAHLEDARNEWDRRENSGQS